MLPELLSWSTSYDDDLAFAREDVLGSAAHATMLGKTKIIPAADARALRDALLSLFRELDAGASVLDRGEEDVHMAVEALLASRSAPAARLHTARSRNDQVALDLRLYARSQAGAVLRSCASLLGAWVERARSELYTIVAGYTHRQKAQPVSFAFQIAAWCAGLSRAAETVRFALDRSNELPLGSGACSGTSLPIDRRLVARLLHFPRPTLNALDTVGDRDFALDFTWSMARIVLSLGKAASDLVDMAAQGLVRLGDSISAGSSMMPQKKNPDVFELLRSKAALGIGDVVALLVLVKGLPSGYNRDQQDDRRALFASGPRALGALEMMALATPHVVIDKEKTRALVSDGSTQATDLAEALVKKGVPFRDAYKAVGALVAHAERKNVHLASISAEEARAFHPELDREALSVLDPDRAMRAKTSEGGTAPERVEEQLEEIARKAADFARAGDVPALDQIAETIAREPL
jgi:argininosuccinate lyase